MSLYPDSIVFTVPFKGSFHSRVLRFILIAMCVAAVFFFSIAVEVKSKKPSPRSPNAHPTRTH